MDSISGGKIYDGFGDGDYHNGLIAMNAIFNKQLTDAQVELCAISWRNLLSQSPVGAWLLLPHLTTSPIVDWTGGGANETARVGTSISTDGPIGYLAG
jgi:hypothetical protein